MYCLRNVTDDLVWCGANDRRLAMFEGVYSVPYGVSYNSYLLRDEKTVLFDTVDKAVRQRFLENLAEALGGRALDYIVVQHMEPDHSAALFDLLGLYPDMKIVCNAKTLDFIKQFNDFDDDNGIDGGSSFSFNNSSSSSNDDINSSNNDSSSGGNAGSSFCNIGSDSKCDIDSRAHLVKEGDLLNTGRHTLHFLMAPMVHWPEVMVTYDAADRILFSADAFGCFGALNGALFADEVDFDKDYMDEVRRYYANIVGKYGKQVESLLKKTSAFEIDMLCPLHGFVWRKDIQNAVSKYALWSSYTPEENGMMIAYASVYGNTENAAEILASRLRDKGVKTAMYDVSVTPASEIVAAAFKWSHLVFASTTYNMGIFVTMDALISDLAAHNIQNRTVAIIENGSWAVASGGLIREKLEKCKNLTFLDNKITIKSSLKRAQLPEIEAMADALIAAPPLCGSGSGVSGP